MKKTLIALAALAATGAFAQSAVSISGYIDRGYLNTNNTNDTKDFTGLGSNAGTTGFVFAGTEDLGGGLKAGFSVATDWADLAGANQDSTATTASSIQTGGFANSQSYIELGGGFGTVRLGTVNNEILTAATGVAAPAFSTGVGSAYSSSWSTHNGYGTGVTGSGGIVSSTTVANTGAGARGIRQANTFKYISPSFSGVTVSLGYAPKNDTGSNGSGTGDTVGVTDFSVRYTKGPLDVMYASLKYDVPANAPLNGGLTANSDNTHTLLGASFQVMPALKLHAGMGRSSANGNTNIDSDSRQFGVTFAVSPTVDLMAQMASMDDKSANDFDRRMTGVGADYKLSKNTRLYARYDSLNLNTNATASGTEIQRTAVGMSVKF